MMSPRTFILTIVLFFLGFAALTVSLNYLVDPYLIMDRKRWSGFNFHKVEIDKHLKMSKAYHPLFREWDTLLVGNSRIEMGLDPHHPCFRKSAQKVYNLGLPGAGVRQQLEYALNLIYQQPIKRVFLSIDFVDFLVRDGGHPPKGGIDWNTPSSRLQFTFRGSQNPEYAWNTFMDYYRALFSLDSSFSSLQTIALQSPRQSDRDDHGFNPARDYKYGVEVEGAQALFAQKMNILESKYSRGWSLRYSDDSLSQSFAVLAKFLEIAEDQGVKVTLFTNPFHQQFWDLLRENNLYEMHQVWLNEVRLVINTVGSVDVSLWDFSANSEYIHEEVPASDIKGLPLTWFWEPAHYRKELGDLMLSSMLADQCQSISRFGERLQ